MMSLSSVLPDEVIDYSASVHKLVVAEVTLRSELAVSQLDWNGADSDVMHMPAPDKRTLVNQLTRECQTRSEAMRKRYAPGQFAPDIDIRKLLSTLPARQLEIMLQSKPWPPQRVFNEHKLAPAAYQVYYNGTPINCDDVIFIHINCTPDRSDCYHWPFGCAAQNDAWEPVADAYTKRSLEPALSSCDLVDAGRHGQPASTTSLLLSGPLGVQSGLCFACAIPR